MTRSLFACLISCVAVGLCVVFLATGCETGGDAVSLTVEPSYVDLSDTSSEMNQTFTVTNGLRQLSLPLEWSVSNPDLGTIASSGGHAASYVRVSGKHGDNAITVKDQYGAEGVATVRQ